MPLKLFPKNFFRAKPVHVILLFILGVFILSRDSCIRENDLFMSWEEITKRFPKLPAKPEIKAPEITTKSATNLVYNPQIPGTERTALDHFFRQLKSSRNGGSARVLHYGDSLLWGDNITWQVRKRMLEFFPNGGRGLLPLAWESSDYVLGGAEQSFEAGGWDIGLLQTMASTSFHVGISLRKYTALHENTWSRIKLNKGEEALALGILADPGKAPLSVRFVLTNNAIVTHNLPKIDRGYLLLTNRMPWREATVTAGRGAVLYGLDVRRAAGLTYSPVVRKGICSHDFPNIEAATFRKQLGEWKPDLVIWQFGKNEAGWDRYTLAKHMTGVRWIITNIRAVLPETSILFVGPGPRLNKYGGPLRLFPSVPEMCAAQSNAASQYGIAYFDAFRALGGEPGFRDLVNRGLAMNDYVHLTVQGGNILGDAIADNILSSWAGWLKDSTDTSLAGQFKKKTDPAEIEAMKAAHSAITFDTVAYGFFLFIVFFGYWLLYHAKLMRILFLIAASYFFYMSWNPIFVVLIVMSSLIDYFGGLLIYSAKRRDKKGMARLWLTVSLCSNLGLLFFFKYFNLFSDFLGQLGVVEGNAGMLELILPVGISFYTFQTMSYSLDIYRGLLAPVKSFVKFSLFVSFFPQLVAGPITRARQLLPQVVARPRFDPAMITQGFFLIVVGLFKKVVISDFLSVNFADRVFASPGLYTPLEVLLGVYAYGLQIYCDFSGYSDIAIGSAAMLGFRLPLNFNSPYKATNLQDFWHRWHISLSTWLRDYLYIPLGGSRKGNARTYINVAITFILGGIWHGAAYRFIIWGALHGIGLGVVRAFQRWRGKTRTPSLPGRILGWLLTFNFIMFAWIFFRAPDMATAGLILEKIAALPAALPDFLALLNANLDGAIALLSLHFAKFAPNVTLPLAAALFGGYLLHMVPNKIFEKTRNLFVALPAPFQSAFLLGFMILLYKTATAGFVPFIYFQF